MGGNKEWKITEWMLLDEKVDKAEDRKIRTSITDSMIAVSQF